MGKGFIPGANRAGDSNGHKIKTNDGNTSAITPTGLGNANASTANETLIGFVSTTGNIIVNMSNGDINITVTMGTSIT